MPDYKIGDMLRARRESIGMSLSEAAETTNIRARVLATFEAGDYAHFPAKGYAQGMLSSYARLLGLDPRKVLATYDAELAEYDQRCEIARNAEYARRGDGRFGMRKPQGAKPVSRGRAAARQMAEERERADEERREIAQAATEQTTARNVKVVRKRSAGRERGSEARRGEAWRGEREMADETRRDTRYDGRDFEGENRRDERAFTGDVRRDERYEGRDFVGDARDGAARGGRDFAGDARRGERGRRHIRLGHDGATSLEDAPRDAGSSGAFAPADAGTLEVSAPGDADVSSSPAPPRRNRLRHSAFEEYKRKMRERDAAEAAGETQPDMVGTSAASGASGRLSRASKQTNAPDGADTGLSDALAATDEEVSAERDRADRRRRRQRDEEERELRSSLTRQQNFFQMLLGVITSIFSERRTRLIAIAAIFLVVAVAIVAVFLISTAGSGGGGVIQVQGGARDDSVATQDAGSASATVTTTNGNPVSVSIVVDAGQTSLVNVTYDDDKAYSGTAVGPWSRSFQVTESMEATFGNPDAVKVTENGQEVQIERQQDGTGKLSLSIQTANAASAAR